MQGLACFEYMYWFIAQGLELGARGLELRVLGSNSVVEAWGLGLSHGISTL